MKREIANFIALALTLLAASCSAQKDSAQEPKVAGRFYPERADDLAWENELVGFRAYGPGTQAKGERAFGYDLFFKYPDKGLVVEKLYAPETDPATWRKVDSLRNISNEAAEDFIASFSYHLDHGLGMDPYPVGPTLGAGVCALVNEDETLRFPWCYTEGEILEYGPERFEVHLVFAPDTLENQTVREHRIISLDAGSHLNRTKVWYEGQTLPLEFFIGVPRRDESKAEIDSIAGYVAYADPTDKREGNTALLGLVMAPGMHSYGESQGHIGARGTLNPGDTVSYAWGFTWPKSDIKDMENWKIYLKNFKY